MKTWMFNCREVSKLVSESLDRELSFTQKMGVRFHLLMCSYCARFADQLRKIRDLVRGSEGTTLVHRTMDSEAKDKLKEYLRNSKNQDRKK
ncbi:MAG: zf-HC2 domain-containing protein [Desulforhopalus sp.]